MAGKISSILSGRPSGYFIIKRSVDLLGASAALVALSPLLLAAAAAVQTTMGSPVLFRQDRPGLHGTVFRLVKFRTMRRLKHGEDPLRSDRARLTQLGSFLRKTSIDELPTLWNVVKGDMSLVGPRPLLVQYLDRYSDTQALRHKVKPGITGWAQINGRNAISWEQKLDLDVWYVDNACLVLDLKILGLTVFKVLKRDGISYQTEATMPEFLGTKESANHAR